MQAAIERVMRRRQPLPRLWMMSDERQGEQLFAALERLPKGAGVVFRHYSLAPRERRQLFRRLRSFARRRSLRLLLAGSPHLAMAWGAEGSHGHASKGWCMPGRLKSMSVHSLSQLKAAERAGADLVFLSPVFATRSHPNASALGPARFGLVSRQARLPVIALGGMNRHKAKRLRGLKHYGWAAIDAWSENI